MSDVCGLTVTELVSRIRGGEVSSREATEAVLDRIEEKEPTVDAYLCVDREGALARAAEIDGRLAKGEEPGRLAGVPVAVKDNMCTRDMPTTCASRILEGYRPQYDAHVVERLRAEGAVILGKTNLDEFAMGSSTEHSAFKPTRNPWNLERTPGGSSGGSAAAVSAGMAFAALGSDTGGSVRQPASMCGVTGLKPTYGRVSRYGLVAFASSLDQIGTLTKDARDAALMMEVIAAPDERDSTCVREPAPGYLDAIETDAMPLRIGAPKEYFGEGLDPEVEKAVRDAIAVYESMGAEIVEVSLPNTEYAVASYYIIAPAEAGSNLARYDGVHYGHRTERADDIISLFSRSRTEGFGAEVQRRILLGTFALSAGYYDAYYLKASKARRLIKRDFDAVFDKVDALACPAAPTPAFEFNAFDDPLSMYLADVYTIPVNMAGIAGLSIPCGLSSAGLPIGLQLLGQAFDEARLLRAAWAFQRETDFHLMKPDL